jgi:nitrite reductase/ring-hydroxylating ferredoxin subunit
MTWINALSLDELAAKAKAIVRHDDRQILLLHTERGVFACANRCPHEGYPLSEGSLADGCVLTCNWHNWKFDLVSDVTLVGGDKLTRYPVRLESGRVWVDVTPPDPALRRQTALAGIAKALEDVDQQRLVREAARLVRVGADPTEAIGIAVSWVAERLEFGTTHAIAGAPDWLRLSEQAGINDTQKVAALGEILGHIADDARSGRCFPLPQGEAPWSETAFLDAIESEDEATAMALLPGALAAGRTVAELRPTLVAAALSHQTRLAAWGEAGDRCPPLEGDALRRTTPKSAMAIVAAWGAWLPPEAIFAVLVESAASILLHVDERLLVSVDAKLADDINWLDFTHMLTFAEAACTAVRIRPALWPAVMLQLACFVGRNAGYVDAGLDTGKYAVADVAGFIAERQSALFDHGRERFIISVHLIKTLLAGEALMRALPEQRPLLAASLNRFLTAPMKGRHVLRTALQMWNLVEHE